MTEKIAELGEKLRNITRTLHRISECPVCLEAMKSPFKTCKNQHSICESCARGTQVCPTCQSSIHQAAPVVPIFVEKLLESLPRMCKYVNSGCGEVVEFDDMNHEAFCGFRLWKCVETDCNREVPLVQLCEHYAEAHPECFVMTDISADLVWPRFDLTADETDEVPVFLDCNWFWIKIHNDTKEKCLKITFKSTPIGVPQNDFYSKITFTKDKFAYQYTLKAKIDTNERYDIKRENDTEEENSNHEDMEIDNDTEFKMSVPQSALTPFINENGSLTYYCEIFSTSQFEQ